MTGKSSPNDIPNYIAAASPKELRRSMFANNIKKNMFFNYFDIQYVESEKKWFAWYFETLDTMMETEVLSKKGK